MFRVCRTKGPAMSLRNLWMAWGDLIRKLVALIASFASMAGLLVVFLPAPSDWPWWVVVILIVAIGAFTLLMILEIYDRKGLRVFAKTGSEEIKQFMHDWIFNGGRVAIWTRDISWAQNLETRRLLTEKARRKELILCLPEITEFASELEAAGAEVCAYGKDVLESPASRFTIAYFGRDGARVAVGRAEGDTHIIEDFGMGRHPAFHLAVDLVSIARALKGKRKR